jgi:hypothetical protein
MFSYLWVGLGGSNISDKQFREKLHLFPRIFHHPPLKYKVMFIVKDETKQT